VLSKSGSGDTNENRGSCKKFRHTRRMRQITSHVKGFRKSCGGGSFANPNPHYRFTAIFMFPENENLRTRLCNLASDNPLAMHRMYRFWSDAKSPKNLLKSMSSHENRVSWQLSRIYRARNSLVHKGDAPSYLDSLVLNIFEYYIRMLATIVRYSSRGTEKVSLDNVVSEIYFDSTALRKILRSKREADANDADLFRLANL